MPTLVIVKVLQPAPEDAGGFRVRLELSACGERFSVGHTGPVWDTFAFFCGSLHASAESGKTAVVHLGDGDDATDVSVSDGAVVQIRRLSTENGLSTYDVTAESEAGAVMVMAPDGEVPVAAGSRLTLVVPAPPDADNDGVADIQDNCSLAVNPGQDDSDGDGAGDACDPDSDGDGVDDAVQDSDGDGVVNTLDNCRLEANPDQFDADQDGVGDVCDPDVGNDGQDDAAQARCGVDPETGLSVDANGDGIPDCVDDDADDDGLPDTWEVALGLDPQNPDSDGDGVVDGADGAPLDASSSDDTVGPVISGLPAAIVVEATGPTTTVVYPLPTALDSITGAADVTCAPISGEGFLVGTTTVVCMAADRAGNTTTASLAVTVQDTTPPVVGTTTDLSAEATSPAGATVTFDLPAATDVVDGSPAVTCAPASGSTFPVGTTTVTCSAGDGAGNTGSSTFVVTVDDVAKPGHMQGEGFLKKGQDRYKFAFGVRENDRRGERGRFSLEVEHPAVKSGKNGKKENDDRKQGKTQDNFRSTAVTFVAFSDDPIIRPGRPRKPLVDTVRFRGVGTWNGQDGYTFEVLATDQGEPGRHRESIAIVIRSSSGQTVAEVSGDLDGGNIQSSRGYAGSKDDDRR